MLLVEEADYKLLGQDLMVALGINLIVKDSKLIVSLYKLTLEDEREINLKVWHTRGEAGKLEMEPISIKIERPEDPIRVKQYPISLEGSPRATTKVVAKKLLEEIIPRYGIADYIDSDQGMHFTSKIIKHLANTLGIR
ncbi:hypothetical protein DUI87_31715 [Hirundo rustica rustica]|uniref:Integrase catalytic domain-containing protein n=1 Tax=Hirundo rustica rustica TaxID=333673 RepID=A0A3M0ITD7_HIRRU|nr:hypothetical protein DUI87_31715 [Hirundo rustica rustica]